MNQQIKPCGTFCAANDSMDHVSYELWTMPKESMFQSWANYDD